MTVVKQNILLSDYGETKTGIYTNIVGYYSYSLKQTQLHCNVFDSTPCSMHVPGIEMLT